MTDQQPLFMLDSGAFSVFKIGSVIDIDQYVEFMTQYQHVFNGGMINLDVIYSDNHPNIPNREIACRMSYENWIYLRKKGIDTIPVYHLGVDERDELDWLKKYMRETDYIALGAVAGRSPVQRLVALDRIWNECLCDANGKPLCKVHGLGMTSDKLMRRYPWYSVDSSSAVMAAGYGRIMISNRNDFLLMIAVSNWSGRSENPMDYYGGMPKGLKQKVETYCDEMGYVLPREAIRKESPRPVIMTRQVRAKLTAAAIRQLTQNDRNWASIKQITQLIEEKSQVNRDIHSEVYNLCLHIVKKHSHQYELQRLGRQLYFRYNGPQVNNQNIFLGCSWDAKQNLALINLNTESRDINGTALDLSSSYDLRLELNFRSMQRLEKDISEKSDRPFHIYHALAGVGPTAARRLKTSSELEDTPNKVLASYYHMKEKVSVENLAILGAQV